MCPRISPNKFFQIFFCKSLFYSSYSGSMQPKMLFCFYNFSGSWKRYLLFVYFQYFRKNANLPEIKEKLLILLYLKKSNWWLFLTFSWHLLCSDFNIKVFGLYQSWSLSNILYFCDHLLNGNYYIYVHLEPIRLIKLLDFNKKSIGRYKIKIK